VLGSRKHFDWGQEHVVGVPKKVVGGPKRVVWGFGGQKLTFCSRERVVGGT
jgi:hypothetical protein